MTGQGSQGGSPPGSSQDPLLQLLNRLLDILEDLLDEIGDDAGPLSGDQLTNASGHASDAEGEIDTLFSATQSPSLDPVDAGSVDTSVQPSGLPAHAAACRDLAQAAVNEANDPSPDHDVIGSKVKTIDSLLPALKQLAGIN
jgi:predicted component of type VI protein secretion system